MNTGTGGSHMQHIRYPKGYSQNSLFQANKGIHIRLLLEPNGNISR
jgi:hypothetical protein